MFVGSKPAIRHLFIICLSDCNKARYDTMHYLYPMIDVLDYELCETVVKIHDYELCETVMKFRFCQICLSNTCIWQIIKLNSNRALNFNADGIFSVGYTLHIYPIIKEQIQLCMHPSPIFPCLNPTFFWNVKIWTKKSLIQELRTYPYGDNSPHLYSFDMIYWLRYTTFYYSPLFGRRKSVKRDI